MDMQVGDSEQQMLQELVAKFVDRELMALEPVILAREASGGKYALTEAEEAPLLAKCEELGLMALDVPESLGGANLPATALMRVEEELARTLVPFSFPPDSPNLHMMLAVANEYQRERYLKPYAEGKAKSAIGISEPGAGGDPAAMTTRAVKDGTDWIINGRKIWVGRVPSADFIILMARTGEGKRAEGVTAFIVERDTPGFIIEREIQMLGGRRTYELVFEDCRVPDSAGAGRTRPRLRADAVAAERAAPANGVRVASGIARRALQMMCEYTQQRRTFGVKLSDRQASSGGSPMPPRRSMPAA